MKKKLLAVLMTGIMAASFAGTATVVSADSGDDNTLTVWGMGPELQYQIYADGW